MGQKKHDIVDPVSEPKKRRRAGFFDIDNGVEAKDCIKVYLVSSKDEFGASNSLCIDPVDLNGFFDDGKLYGYQGLKINVWFSIVSFQAFADISYESTSDGGKGITDLKSALQSIFAETLVDNKEEFLRTFSRENNLIGSIISNGEVLQEKTCNGYASHKVQSEAANSDLQVVRLVIGNTAAGDLYCRLIPLVLLLVDGSSPIDVSDTRWELYLLIRKETQQGDSLSTLLGFSALYRFYHYPDTSRLRLSQILVLPPYQHKGYGRFLLEFLNNVAISENVYDFTIEEPLDSLQHIRTCIDVERLVRCELVQEAVNSAISELCETNLSKKVHTPRSVPPPVATENVRKFFKITKKQFFRCWEVLIYLGLNPVDSYIHNFLSVVSARMRDDIIGKDSGGDGKQVIDVASEFESEMSFAMFRTQQGGEATGVQMDDGLPNQEDQLKQLVEERVEEIKRVAQKLSKR